MRVCPLFPALHLYLSDTEQTHPRRVRMRGLRHKPRHKFRAPFAGTPSREAEHPALTQLQRVCACAKCPYSRGSWDSLSGSWLGERQPRYNLPRMNPSRNAVWRMHLAAARTSRLTRSNPAWGKYMRRAKGAKHANETIRAQGRVPGEEARRERKRRAAARREQAGLSGTRAGDSGMAV
jgi:hypothetical protein